ncbi:hypothetical protein ISCGN_001248 [Ixodes scapularis]
MLRNLSNEAITGITKYINECWRQGQLPRQWKTAKVVLIPKPGKKPQLDALRPISLTSCVGKIMEHVVLRRINDFMERNQLFPHTMVGFRPHLSTQDVMLRLKHQIIDGEKSSHLDTRVILGLDLTKAFDTIRHDAVLENLEKLGVGRRTFNYIQDFLSDRTAQISIGGVTSDDINLGGRGTPQGSVLSPYLFNVAMIELPAKLSKIEGLHHSIYADDITLWMTGGCDGFIQDTLQEAIRTIEECAKVFFQAVPAHRVWAHDLERLDKGLAERRYRVPIAKEPHYQAPEHATSVVSAKDGQRKQEGMVRNLSCCPRKRESASHRETHGARVTGKYERSKRLLEPAQDHVAAKVKPHIS